ncbi:MAG: sugar transferase [Chloroflexota bacterium]|nr:MAG: sugar transferase [Chloroflexota bacterium]
MNEIRLETQRSRQRSYPFALPQEYQRSKRALDLTLATLLLLLFSPIFLLIVIAIKLDSQGPIFYRQRRIGKHGRPFDMLKFRSMLVNADSRLHKEYVQSLIRNNTSPQDLGGNSLKLKADPRVTRVGRIIRKLSLDEVPQLFNVLSGEMSIVGPRPPIPYEYELYSNWHKQRMSVLPGITGLWQATAHNRVSFDEMVRIDLDYIGKMNIWLDLKIMVLTPLEMIRGKG